MGLGQLVNSIRQIVENPYVPTGQGLVRHAHWQVRKAFNRFPFEQQLAGSRIMASHRNCAVSALINSQGLYDYNNMRLLQWLLRDGGTFFDIGANIGSYTLVASEQERARVFAFEPHPVTARLLSDNIRLNRRGNVTVCPVAVGQEDGVVRLTDRAGSSVNHSVTGDGGQTVEVSCRRAETLCREYEVFPRYVKVDVEGFEFEVLTGFGPFLRHVELLLIEFNGLSAQRSVGDKAIHEWLTAAGFRGAYRCEMKDRAFLAHAGLSREDALYVRESLQADLRRNGWVVEQLG
jgi:FkbM family methyltransferase